VLAEDYALSGFSVAVALGQNAIIAPGFDAVPSSIADYAALHTGYDVAVPLLSRAVGWADAGSPTLMEGVASVALQPMRLRSPLSD